MQKQLGKLSSLSGNDWVPHSHQKTFSIETMTGDTIRLAAGVPSGDVSALLRLIECLAAPFMILYVLHTPRGEAEPGRYQSPPLEKTELENFISEYSSFLSGDARFDIWIRSSSTNGMIVWDRHNMLFAYGPIDSFSSALREIGFTHGKPTIPEPHMHMYHQELDEKASALISKFAWHHSPLRREDEQ